MACDPKRLIFAGVAVAVLVLALGCKTGGPSPTAKTGKHVHPTEGPNKKGPLAGFDDREKRVDLGHAEITVSDDGEEIVVYFVDEKAEKKMKIEPDKITDVAIKFKKPLETKKWITLKYDKDKSTDKGHAFVGKLPEKMTRKSNTELEGVIRVKLDELSLEKDFPEEAH